MASVIPAFASAMQDRALRGHPREVYIWLHEHLDVLTFRSIKHSAIETGLGMNSMAVSRAITRLVEDGYINRGDREGRLWTYRLVYSNPPRPVAPPEMLPVVERRQ